MKNRISICAATFIGLAVLAPLGGCMSSELGTGTGGTSGGGSSGNAGSGGHAGGGGAPVNCSAGGSTGGSSALANWDTMRMIVQQQCGGPGCHNDTQTPHFVDDANLYATLTTYVSTMCGNRVMVKPCFPEESAFYLAQRGECGTLEKMPKGCSDLCTPDSYLEGIRQWIANGAPKQ
jgi:hypothetical protein